MRLDEVYQAALQAGSGGIRYNDSTKIIQLMDIDKNWVNWRYWNGDIMNSGIKISSLLLTKTSKIAGETVPVAGCIIYATAQTSSANNHMGTVVEIDLIGKTGTQTLVASHYNVSSSATEEVTITFENTNGGYFSYKWAITKYSSYTQSYGMNINASFVYITT